MHDFHKIRKHKFEEKAERKQKTLGASCLTNKEVIKKLSLSFYGHDTIKRQKQIILDQCDLVDEILVPSYDLLQNKAIQKKNVMSKQNEIRVKKYEVSWNLKIDNFFQGDKIHPIEMITTNATQPEQRKKDYAYKSTKTARSKSVKSKVAGGRPATVRQTQDYGVSNRSARSVSRPSQSKEHRFKKY